MHLDTYALLINFLGCYNDRAKYKEVLYNYLEKVQNDLCENCKIRKEKNIMSVFDCKNPQCQELYKEAPFITDDLCSICQKDG